MLNFTALAILLSIAVESVFLVLQIRGRILSRILGDNAFPFHAIITSALWVIALISIFLLQRQYHPPFHDSVIFSNIGLVVCIAGVALSIWALKDLGIRRALCANFYYVDVKPVKTILYRYMKNPMDMGLWGAFLGFAIFTRSMYNLALAFELIALMIPHIYIENRKLPS